MKTLGVSAYYHDSAVAYVDNQRIVKAAKEQHFSREINSHSFPKHSVDWVKQAYEDFDEVIFYEQATFNRFKTDIKHYSKTAPTLVDHHEAHAMSAIMMNAYKSCAVIVADMLGGKYSLSLGYYDGTSITWLKRFTYPNSLGLLYSSVTRFLGYTPLIEEHKTMYCARRGQPTWASWAYDNVIDFNDNSFDILVNATRGFGRGCEDANIAATAQSILQDILVSLANWLHHETGSFDLAFSGQLAENTDLCSALSSLTPYLNIHIPSAPGEAGCALGAAAIVSKPLWETPYLGKTEQDLVFVDDCANKVLRGEIVPVIHGKTEFSSTSLGNRSYLCVPTPENIHKLNILKDQDARIPYSVVCQESEAAAFFDTNMPAYYKQFAYRIIKSNYSHLYNTQIVQLVNITKNAYINKILEKTKQYGFPFLICADLAAPGKPLINSIEDYNNEI